MSKVIEVLASMASDASLQNEAAVEKLLNTAELNAELNIEQSTAIITKDLVSLERQLDICPDIVCILAPAEDDEKEDTNEEDTNEDHPSVING